MDSTLPHMLQEQLDNPNSGYYPAEDIPGGLPINLDSLRDGPPGSKPFYPYSTLIRYAIKGSPNQKLLLEDIYYAIESRFPYFRNAPSGWKNSVRHNLSLNPCFEKVARPLTDRGKGSYWTVNDHVDPRTGVHRVRKKKSKAKGRVVSEDEPDMDYHPADGYEDATAQFVAAPQPDDVNAQARAVPFPPYHFDPNFAMMNAMRFPPLPGTIPGPMPISPDEGLDLDEHGQVDWRLAWHKELGHLQRVTTEQDETGGDQEWYRMMLFRIRTALMPPMPMNPDGTFQMPMPPPPPGSVQPQPQ